MLPRQKAKSVVPKSHPARERAAEISRFTVVGILASLTYLVVSNILILASSVDPALSSVGAYVLGMVVSFTGQSRFTFKVERASLGHFYKFVVLSVFGLAFSYVSVIVVVDVLDLHPVWATLATVTIVPVASYIIMKVWVFAVRVEGEDGTP